MKLFAAWFLVVFAVCLQAGSLEGDPVRLEEDSREGASLEDGIPSVLADLLSPGMANDPDDGRLFI